MHIIKPKKCDWTQGIRRAIWALFLLSALSSPAFSAQESPQRPILKSQEIYSHFLNAVVLERQGMLKEALKEYNQTLELEPSASTIYRQRASLYLKMGDPQKALKDVELYIQKHPEDIETVLLLANIFGLVGQRDKQKQTLEELLQKHPKHSETLLILATTIMEEDPERAIELFKQYIALEPNVPDVQYQLGLLLEKLGQKKEAKATFEEIIQSAPESIQALILLGQSYENSGDIPKAVDYYSKALESIPNNFSLRLQLLELYYQQMNLQAMQELLDPYEKDWNAPTEALWWLGVIHEQKKEWEEALKYYTHLWQKSQDTELLLRIAGLYTQLEQYKNALKWIQILVKKNPENSQFQYFLGLSYKDVKQLKKAKEAFQKATHLNPEFSQAYLQLGIILEELDQWPLAEKALLEAIRTDPNNATAYNYLAYSYAEKNIKLAEAKKHIQKALELDPKNPAFLDSLGWIHFKQGNFKDALYYLKRASEAIQDPEIDTHLGECYQALENIPEAANHYSQALLLDPKNKKLQKKLERLHQWFVPTAPARHYFSKLQENIAKNPKVSGLCIVRNKTGLAKLFPKADLQGLFALERQRYLHQTRSSFRLDLMNIGFGASVSLSYKRDPTPQWEVFPPELKNPLPKEIEALFESATSVLDGTIVEVFDQWETRVAEKKSKFILTYQNQELVLDKKSSQIIQLKKPGQKFFIKKFQRLGETSFPQKMEFQYLDSQGQKKKWRTLSIEFLQLIHD